MLHVFRQLPPQSVLAAFGAALLFGASTPLAKILLGSVSPWMLAGLLYLGSGLGLGLVAMVRRGQGDSLAMGDRGWLAAAIVFGGVLGPVLLMWGLAGTGAATASLLLNAEGLFTALIAWVAFRENVDRHIALGMVAIVAGAVVLSWPDAAASFPSLGRPLAILGACLCWAVDNNLTRKVSLSDPVRIAAWKGLAAGVSNLALAWIAGAAMPPASTIAMASAVGFVGYGVSLVLFVLGLRGLGAARAGAYFSAAPFVGAVLAIPLLGERVTLRLLVAGLLMGFGLWLHLRERHEHEHGHEALGHSHQHSHDDPHHRHTHEPGELERQPHSHWHRHEPIRHSHPHYPDAHHRHGHPGQTNHA